MTGPASIVPIPGPQTIPFLPAYIPDDVDIVAVKVDVAGDGISAPVTDVPALRQVVADAGAQGVDLKIVVIANNPPIDTPLRDIATEVGSDYPDATVLALSPSYAGTYSRNFDRVTLEAGEDLAKTGNPVQSSQNFVSQLNEPQFPWTGLTVAVLIGVLAATIVTRLLQRLSKREALATGADTTPDRTA